MLTITDQWLQSVQLTEQDARIELALALLRAGRISFEQAQELVGMETLEFLSLLDQKGIQLEYGVADLKQDISTLQRMRQL
jgi:predicted HTH domain antitoxin